MYQIVVRILKQSVFMSKQLIKGRYLLNRLKLTMLIVKEMMYLFRSDNFKKYLRTTQELSGLIQSQLRFSTLANVNEMRKIVAVRKEYLETCLSENSKISFNDVAPHKETLYIGHEIVGVFGHSATCIADRIKANILGLANANFVILSSRPANKWLIQKYWSQYVPVIELDELSEKLLEIQHFDKFENWNFQKLDLEYLGFQDAHNSIESIWEEIYPESRGGLLQILEDDKIFGYSFLDSFGFKPTDWFVSLHVRSTPGSQVSRNNDISYYKDSIMHILELGGWVIRIGAEEAPVLDIRHERYIDYANLGIHNSRLDIFFLAESIFLIGSSSGPNTVPALFGKPMLWTNATGICSQVYFSNTIVIPKLVRNFQKNNILKFKELLTVDTDFGNFDDFPAEIMANYRYIENTSDEILNGVREMFEMLEDPTSLKSNLTDEQLIYEELQIDLGHKIVNPISPYFANKHRNLFH
jgi:putative glycosyltransferase (TIGR04372 family)